MKGDTYLLWSGFIGAIIGAWATIQSSKSVIRETENIERGLRKEEEHARRQSILEALRAEVEFNLKTINSFTDMKLVNFSSSAWEAFRAHIRSLKKDVREPLLTAYCAVAAHQNALAIELKRGSAGPGVLQDNVFLARDNFKKALDVGVWMLTP